MQKTVANTDAVLALALDVGKSMVRCGAEINRVEETVLRICHAYGIRKTEVFSVISMIHATVTDGEGIAHTQMRRIYTRGVNFRRLENLNALSRKICATTPDIHQIRKELETICIENKRFDIFGCLGYVVAAMAFTVFFGGGLLDSLASAPIAVVLYLINLYVKVSGVNKLFFTALSSAIAGFAAITFVHFGFGHDANMIMIGDIMLLIPGLMLINSVREMLCGDLMSGLLRLLESVVLALSIACGFAVAIMTLGRIW